MTSIVDMVNHYQRSIDKSKDNQARLLHCIEKLHKLPITVEHLQETGIGRTVNGLRKYDGEVGYAAKALVTKWKQMVASEEPEDEVAEQQQHMESCENADQNDDDEDDDYDNSDLKLEIDETENIEPEPEALEEDSTDDKVDDYHNEISDSKKHKHAGGNDKHKHRSEKHSEDRHRKEKLSSHNGDSKKSESRSSRDKDKHKTHSHHSSSDKHKDKKHSSSSSKHHHHSSSSSKNPTTDSANPSKRDKKEKEAPSTDSKRDYSKNGSDTEKRDSSKDESSKRRRDDEKSDKHSSKSEKSSSSSRHRKEDDRPTKKRKVNDIDDMVIDSSMGASFADALGMLDQPSSSKKKSQRPLKQSPSDSKSSKSEPKPKEKSYEKVSKIDSASSSSSYAIQEPKAPLLLTKRPKLEPLPDITFEITPNVPFTISNNYKPLPLNPTVMDCVYNQPKQKSMTDEEALSYSIMSKKERTKVFSGQKTGFRGEVPSLYDLCIRVLQDNIDDLEYTGGIPYEILKPILERASVQQLLNIEDYNPYLVEETDSLWQIHCKRRFRGRQPEELESWRELFLRLQDEQDAKLASLTKNIKATQEKKIPVKKTKLAFVDNYIKPPRNVLKKQERFGTNSLATSSPAMRVASLEGHVGAKLARPGDTKLRVANAIRDAAVPTQPARVNPNRKAPLMQKTLMSIKKLKQR